jgi:putative AdoMet-dependent methyltransferase
MSEPEGAGLFDRWAKNYDTSVMDGAFPFTGYEAMLDEVVRLADARPAMRVLELGIGTGNLAGRFLQKGCPVWGIDFSAEMLARTRAKYPQIALVQADLLGDWPDALLRPPYDRIVSAYVLHEFDLASKLALLQRAVKGYLAANGSILVADIAFTTIEARSEAYDRLKIDQDEDECYWAADETLAACERAGLQATYQQISVCGGVFTFKASPQ